MINRLKKKENLIPIAIYACVLIVYHLLIREYGGDTFNFYAKQMGGHPTFKRIFEIMHDSYLGISSGYTSRVIVEIPLFILTNGMHVVLWSIMNIILHVMMFASLMKITDFKHNKLLLCLLLIYPVYDLCNAGWITVYISYFWPLALGVVAMVSLKKLYLHEKIGIPEGIFYILCMIYSTNLEICAALYMCVLILFFAAMSAEHRWEKGNRILPLIELVVCIGAFIFIFASPGNYVRTGSDIRFWFPDYQSLTIIDKLVLSTNALMSELINNNLLWFLLCCLLLLIIIVNKKDDIKLIVLAAVPVSSVLIRTALVAFAASYMSDLKSLFDIYAGTARVDATNYNSFASYFPFIWHMAMIIIVAYLMMVIADDGLEGLSDVFLLLGGLATRLVLAFSPSVYASGRRTMIVIDYMFIYLMIRIYDRHCAKMPAAKPFTVTSRVLMYLLTVFIFISNAVSICFEYYYG